MTSTHAQVIPAHLRICDIPLVNITLDDAVIAIESALVARSPTRIGFINTDCVNLAAKTAQYRRSLATMDWLFIDGVGMRIAGKVLQQPVCANVNGTDLFPKLCAALAAQQKRLYLLGGKPGVAAAAAQWAVSNYPGLIVAGTYDGYFSETKSNEVVAAIRAARADVLLVGLGAPRQENWISAHFETCNATVTIGVGGLFDYYSGRIPRAPLWMRRLGLEWLFRLYQEPRRLWQRYLVGNLVFLFRIARVWASNKISMSSIARDSHRGSL